MNSQSIWLIITLGILLAASAYFSATETAFSSINKIRMKNMAGDGNKRAKLVLDLEEEYDKILSTILIGNNIVNIASASLATVIFTEYFGNAGVTISTIVMTVLVLIFGEISPKSLAKEAPESFAMVSAPILKVFTMVLMPLNAVFMAWKKLLSKLFRVSDKRGVTEEELITMVEEAESDGEINREESQLIRSAIEFNDLSVTDILTPRIDIVAVDEQDPPEVIAKLFEESGYSRLPVYRDSIDNIIGVLHLKDFFNRRNKSLVQLLKPVIFTMHSVPISKMLKLLQEGKCHFAVVTDEYGGTMGIVTLEDIIEELVGEIWDEHDEVVTEVRQLEEGLYQVSGSANLDKTLKLWGLETESELSTISGWIVEQLGRIPEIGEELCCDGLEISVTKADGKRIIEAQIAVPQGVLAA